MNNDNRLKKTYDKMKSNEEMHGNRTKIKEVIKNSTDGLEQIRLNKRILVSMKLGQKQAEAKIH